MATILLSAAGAAVGAGFGSSVLGLSGAVIGRAVGATVGRMIDQRLMGAGSQAVETGRMDRFRLTGASEGAPVGQVWGRMRVAGQVIWAARFLESASTSGGGKGMPSKPKVTEYSYSVSLALALCEGEITRVGRIWADGVEISRDDVVMRVYSGREDQLPDPKMEAVEGAGAVPAYRGIAYVVFEDLQLSAFGNRVPQFSFEVLRPAQGAGIDAVPDLARGVKGVALIPGTGEYALATTPVHFDKGLGENVSANINSPLGKTDLAVSLETLREELPACSSASLVVSWFGDDLRCAECNLKPKVEDTAVDGAGMPWRAGGILRGNAEEVVRDAGRPIYGGTPADDAVVEAIAALRTEGVHTTFYPFILMEQMPGNGRRDPWTSNADQPSLPWRGRITLSIAPGGMGSPDRSSSAEAEVAAFFGTAQKTDYVRNGTHVGYVGPQEWSYRRFILHYAHLCAAAGGVDAFCIGSEMRGLTQIRGLWDSFPAVDALRDLARDVRIVLGPATKISYAADWSEYFGYQDGAGNLFYNLDPLWADPDIDFIGIDNYMPLSDWREGQGHLDADWGSIYNLDYLKANVAGGEGYDWFYSSPAHRDAQIRTPITDGAYGEDWVWRYKDILNWWSNPHFARDGGVKTSQSPWVPQSKPIWFTEFGCAAIDKGTNQPNKFLDPRSSESVLPEYSTGRRDDLIQMQYLRAMVDYWSDEANNPRSTVYSGQMVDTERGHVWAWDTRPYPIFPANTTLWADGTNYARGHWINGRVSAQPLSSVVSEICAQSGVGPVDVSGLHGLVRGYSVTEVNSGRAALQPLMLAFGFDALERDGVLTFRMRDGLADYSIDKESFALGRDTAGPKEMLRLPEAEMAGRVRLSYVDADGDYESRTAEAIFPNEESYGATHSEFAIALIRSEGQAIVERWLSEARVARDGVRFTLPPSLGYLGAGDIVDMGPAGRYRVDRTEQSGSIEVEAVRVEPNIYLPSDEAEEQISPRIFAAPVPVFSLFMDLPMLSGAETPHQPHLAVTATPWPGSVAVYASDTDAGYSLNKVITRRSLIGRTQSVLYSALSGVWDRGDPLRVKISGGELTSVTASQLLNGANLMAIGDGSSDNWELIQFADAILVAPNTYDLSLRLRGQAGTDSFMPSSWSVGSYVVLINGALAQLDLALAERDLARHYRIGPSRRNYDDPSFSHSVAAFAGAGLRPLSPVHLSVRDNALGDLIVTWTRRTRLNGDSWSGLDVPLGEAQEAYLLRIVGGGSIQREVTLSQPSWVYPAAMRAADSLSGQFEIHVAQLSDVFGPGPFRRIAVDV